MHTLGEVSIVNRIWYPSNESLLEFIRLQFL